MTFLNHPMLFGLIGVLIPILIHLLNRRRAAVVDWAAMRFLLASHASRNRRIMIEEMVLMTVRCLTVGLVAMAMARPFLPSGQQAHWAVVLTVLPAAAILAAVGTTMWSYRLVRWSALALAAALAAAGVLASIESDWRSRQRWATGGGAKDVAIVIDGSMSMTLGVDGRTNFQRAVDEARAVIASCRSSDAVSIVLGSTSPQEFVPAPVSDRKQLSVRIEALVPAGGAMDVLKSLDMAAATLERGQNAVKKIVLITDGQNVGWDLPASSPAATAPAAGTSRANEDRWRWLADGFAAMPSAPQVICRRLGLPEKTNNLCVDDLMFSRKVVGTDRPVSMAAKVANTGSAPAGPAAVELLINGMAVARQDVGQVTPGAAETVTFSRRFERPGLTAVSARVVWEDDLPSDNVAVRMVNVLDELPALIVEGAPSSEPLGGAAAFIEIALAPMAVARSRPAGAAATTATSAPAGEDELRGLAVVNVVHAADTDQVKNLGHYRLVILCNVSMLPKSMVKELHAFVRHGGGLLIVPGEQKLAGDKAPSRPYDNWTGPSGEPLAPARVQRRIANPQAPARLATASFNHPVLQLLAGTEGGDVGQALIHAYWQLEVDDKDPSVRVAGRLDSGDPFLVERKIGKGLVLMSCTSLDRRENNLPSLRGAFVPLVHEMMNYLASPLADWGNVESGCEASLETPVLAGETPAAAAGALDVITPANLRREGRYETNGRSWKLSCPGGDEPGLYRFILPPARPHTPSGNPASAPAGARSEIPFAVVNQPAESRLIPLTAGDLRQTQRFVPIVTADSTPELTAIVSGQVPGSEIWRPLAALAGLGLIGEIVLTRWIARRRKSHTAAPVSFSNQGPDVASFRTRAMEMLTVPPRQSGAGGIR